MLVEVQWRFYTHAEGIAYFQQLSYMSVLFIHRIYAYHFEYHSLEGVTSIDG